MRIIEITSFLRVGGMLLLLIWQGTASANVANTLHNLSASGPGSYRAFSESEICRVCHAPHNTNPADPLWNHTLSGQNYTPYSSGTIVAVPGQPTGTSKLCLSCHDGTVAVGSVQNLPSPLGGRGIIPGLESSITGSANLETDLSDDHPISFVYDGVLHANNLELVNPAALTGAVKLDQTEQLQCGSCHDPHTTNYKFLRVAQTSGGYGSPLCLTCHDKLYWSTVINMPHRESLSSWNGIGPNPWHVQGHNQANDPITSTPRANGCENCHKSHSGGADPLLKTHTEPGYNDDDSSVCLGCHNGNVASPAKNIKRAIEKRYSHPIMSASGSHIPQRIDTRVRETATNLGANRHSECQDCHNPHAVSAGVTANPEDSPSFDDTTNQASNVLKGVWGVEPIWPSANFVGLDQTTDYTVRDDIGFQYQLCLKCHSSYAFDTVPPRDTGPEFTWGDGLVIGWNGELTDQAMEFNPNNASFHPVVRLRNSNAGSLINGLLSTSLITCSDCHSGEEIVTSGTGGAPKGPHGSEYWPILAGVWNPDTGIYVGSNYPSQDQVLCFRCHDVNAYTYTSDTTRNFNGGTGFSRASDGANLHRFHSQVGRTAGDSLGGDIRKGLPCVSCHARVPHGWKGRAMLVYKDDPSPYNAGRSRRPIWLASPPLVSDFPNTHDTNHAHTGCADYDYGIERNADGSGIDYLDPVFPSRQGDWLCDNCHIWEGCGPP